MVQRFTSADSTEAILTVPRISCRCCCKDRYWSWCTRRGSTQTPTSPGLQSVGLPTEEKTWRNATPGARNPIPEFKSLRASTGNSAHQPPAEQDDKSAEPAKAHSGPLHMAELEDALPKAHGQSGRHQCGVHLAPCGFNSLPISVLAYTVSREAKPAEPATGTSAWSEAHLARHRFEPSVCTGTCEKQTASMTCMISCSMQHCKACTIHYRTGSQHPVKICRPSS